VFGLWRVFLTHNENLHYMFRVHNEPTHQTYHSEHTFTTSDACISSFRYFATPLRTNESRSSCSSSEFAVWTQMKTQTAAGESLMGNLSQYKGLCRCRLNIFCWNSTRIWYLHGGLSRSPFEFSVIARTVTRQLYKRSRLGQSDLVLWFVIRVHQIWGSLSIQDYKSLRVDRQRDRFQP